MNFFENAIKETISLSGNEYSTESFNIAYGADENFLFGTGISIASILLNNTNMQFHFHIFTDHIDNKQRELFNELCKSYNTRITFYILNIDVLKSLPTNKVWSHAIYFRIIIADYFFNKINTILYLDSDIVCNGKLNELEKIDMASTSLAAVIDRDEAFSKEMAHLFNAKGIENGYFNSGVILINTVQWHNNNLTEKTLAIFTNEDLSEKITFYDQDAINIAVNGNLIILDKKYNQKINLNDRYRKIVTEIKDDSIFVHFIGLTKPWHQWSRFYKPANIFLVAKEKSPWKQESLMEPQNMTHYKYASRHLKLNKKYLLSFGYYLIYSFLKRTKK